jgi:hypothetical protein
MHSFFQWLVIAYAPLHARYALTEECGNTSRFFRIVPRNTALDRSGTGLPLVDRDTLDDRRKPRGIDEGAPIAVTHHRRLPG